MREGTNDGNAECGNHLPPREWSNLEAVLDNLPYIVMLLLGAAVLLLALGRSARVAAGLYVAYGILGALWIILFVCPYCPLYGTHKCPCGYGAIAAHLRGAQDRARFLERFRRNIPVIVPLWFIPLLVGGLSVWRHFTWLQVGLLALFAIDAFVLLPLLARKHGCAQCSQRDNCPWMRRTKSAT